jgi:hypothetical protein
MIKFCPFKKIITTRMVNDSETVEEEEFGLCDETRCMAYRTWCLMITKEIV